MNDNTRIQHEAAMENLQHQKNLLEFEIWIKKKHSCYVRSLTGGAPTNNPNVWYNYIKEKSRQAEMLSEEDTVEFLESEAGKKTMKLFNDYYFFVQKKIKNEVIFPYLRKKIRSKSVSWEDLEFFLANRWSRKEEKFTSKIYYNCLRFDFIADAAGYEEPDHHQLTYIYQLIVDCITYYKTN